MERFFVGAVAAVALMALIYIWLRKYGFKYASKVGKEMLETDAKSFARLLVAEIKLYNDYKVQRGLQNGDLYESLRDEIEAARKKYKKQVPYAELDKYFEQALSDILAGGDKSKMG